MHARIFFRESGTLLRSFLYEVQSGEFLASSWYLSIAPCNPPHTTLFVQFLFSEGRFHGNSLLILVARL